MLGFALGAVVGFIYGQKARAAAPGHVSTKYSSGVVTISADVGGIASQALTDFFSYGD